jgi:pimeloyl-ACP methyl ester carboxylesterase
MSAFIVVMLSIISSATAESNDAVRQAPALGSNRPVPASTMTIHSLHVEKYGAGDSAVVLVPGLGCGAWVWDSTIRSLSVNHTVYAVTLPGFDGTPAVPGAAALDNADAGIDALIKAEHLVKPILVGHSLGGFLTIRYAEEHSDELGAAVTVDGMPVFPTLAQMTVDQRHTAAELVASEIDTQTRDQYVTSERSALATMVTDPTVANQAAALVVKSDQAATAEYAREMTQADLRPALDKIHVPVLVVAPVPKDLPAGYPDSLRSLSPDQLSAVFASYDRALFPGATTLKVIPIANSRHFAMLDQPETFDAILESFIDGLQ